jgi:hypothetical protein
LLPRNPYSTSLAWCCFRPHLSIRFGSKARPAARDSVIKHLVFGVTTRSRGTPAGCHCRQPAENFIRSCSTEIFTAARRGDDCGNLFLKISRLTNYKASLFVRCSLSVIGSCTKPLARRTLPRVRRLPADAPRRRTCGWGTKIFAGPSLVAVRPSQNRLTITKPRQTFSPFPNDQMDPCLVGLIQFGSINHQIAASSEEFVGKWRAQR